METTEANPDSTYDLIVIGGGCNGTGIARDASLRGIRTLLLEKDDFGNGTTGYSSHMIHGGSRYLLFDRETTKTSCLDSGFIQKTAPHLLYRIPFLVPFHRSTSRNPLKRFYKDHIYTLLAQAFFRGYDQYQPLKNGKSHTHLTQEEVRRLEPGLTAEISCAISTDEWWIDVFRLCLLNALDAERHGADVRTGVKVEGFLRDETGRVCGVRTRDTLSGKREEFFAKILCNATGPWSPLVAKMVGAEVKLRPGKGTHLVLDRRISNWGVITKAVDGRDIFFIPDHNCTLVGTTDDDFYGDPDELVATQDEIEYLLEGIAKAFPSIRDARILRAHCGVRPTLYSWGQHEEDLSRAHKLFDHAREGAPGLVSIAGGKLASFRLMAEEVTDFVAEQLAVSKPCQTHLLPLPGGETTPDAVELAQKYGLPELTVRRLLSRHGSLTPELLEEGSQQSDGFAVVCQCEPILRCEVRYCLRHEHVRKLSDLNRRTRLAMGPCQGMCCAWDAALLFCEEKGLHPSHAQEQYWELQEKLWREQAPCLHGATLRQASLQAMLHRQHGRPASYPTQGSTPGGQR